MARIAAIGLTTAALILEAGSRAQGVGDAENISPTMVGDGWVAVGDAEDRDAGQARLVVDLPCPGKDVGFNPQPDPPGLEVIWGRHAPH